MKKKLLACIGWVCALSGAGLLCFKKYRNEDYYDITAVTDWKFED